MKTICTKENLRKALGMASKVVSTTSTLPILNNVLLRTEAGQLLISSTNLEIAVKTRVGGQIDEGGEITVPARTLTDFVNNISEDKVTLETKGTDLLIKTKKTESLLKGLSADEFPLIPEVKPILSATLDAQQLSEALNQVAFATAYSETQPELSGVLFSFNEQELRLAATDRYRLAERSLKLSEAVPQAKLIIPNRAIAELSRILADADKHVELLIAETQVLFRTATTDFVSRIIEAQYPDYQHIIPKDFVTQMTISVEEFISALKLSGLFVQDSNNVELAVVKDQNSLVLKANSQRFGSNTTQITGEVVGEDNQIVFNYRYILDCLNHVNDDTVVLKIINGASPAMIVPQHHTDYLYLAMPIKI